MHFKGAKVFSIDFTFFGFFEDFDSAYTYMRGSVLIILVLVLSLLTSFALVAKPMISSSEFSRIDIFLPSTRIIPSQSLVAFRMVRGIWVFLHNVPQFIPFYLIKGLLVGLLVYPETINVL